jgi:outer membrane usher protein
VGDFVESSLSWTRPVRFEGAQLRSDFSTRPDLITFPMPAVGGQTAVPSTVTVLANGSQVSTSQVEAGPFQIQQLPLITGANTLTMTVTNALGQQVTVNQPFYASSTLLAPGLRTCAVQAGLVRRNWGTQSNAEGKPAGNALYRRGLSRWLTVEGSAEGTPGAFMAGGGGVMTVGHWGVVNLAVAGSTGSEKTGVQYAVGAQRTARKFSLGCSAIFASRNYRDVAAMSGAAILRKQISPYVSSSLRRLGTIGAGYAGLDQDAPPVALAGSSGTALHSKALTANYTLSFRRMSFFATAYRSFDGVGGGSNRQFQFGLTIPLGRRRSAYLTGSSAGSGQAQVQQSASIVGDWGYQAYVAADSTTKHEFEQMQYKSRAGLLTGGVDTLGGVTTGRIEAQGAMSFVDGGLFPSNYVYDSFGIVDTAPVPNVHVLQENRQIGKTDRSGRMLVPDMRAFELNRVGVVATDVPPDATLDIDSFQIRPQDRSGVVIKFPMKFSYGALLKLADESGAPVPLGSTATLVATGATYPVGYNGEAFVENLGPHNELRVERPNERVCAVGFDYKQIPGDLPTIGPLRCVEQKP